MGMHKSSQVKRELVSVETARQHGNSLRSAVHANGKTPRGVRPTDMRRGESRRKETALVALPPSLSTAASQLSMRQRLGELRAAIADGFLIQEPIYARPLWSSPDDSRLAYSFVLQNEESIRLITVPDGRTVQQFIRKHELQVDYRR